MPRSPGKRKTKRGYLRRFFIWGVPALLIVGPVVLLYLIIDRDPLVLAPVKLDADSAARARAFAKRTIEDVLDATEPTVLTASESEINSLTAMASRAMPRLSARVNMTPWGMVGALTFRLPRNPFGEYVNALIYIGPSSSGVNIDSLKVGKISVPGRMALTVLRTGLDFIAGERQGTLFMSAIDKVVVEDRWASVYVRPIPDLKERLARIKIRLKGYRDTLALSGDPATVRHYYREIQRLADRKADRERVSLAEYLGPLFKLARERAPSSTPSEENRAVVLALATYFGSLRFESFIGPVRTEEMKGRPRYTKGVVLGGRKDLRLHFIISAGLKILSDSNISHGIGEFKELIDVGPKGSGFSFADLAADRAGVRLAEVATDDAGGARRLQLELSRGVEEAAIFPDVSDLPEGLSQTEFEARYGGLESPAYQAAVGAIDGRIDRLPVYRGIDARR